ncbi:hypothetical protein [[Clostridium] polysaccharolyticum]|uniref:ABC-2 family transporter protein n=1 Tax=[Clostridium] polysaccharolyticum TaxID=29364 RepID=A0A1I0BB37_9FIRM|nr:hypothetical protein [[Clostridium] polysaccharolyticum]SET03357.1 hypothetical protein SAMN04487772_10728 [[Clostridium] polysaccharolyticum]
MKVLKTIYWREMRTGRKSLGRIAGYIVVLVAALYNFKMHQTLFQELMYVAYGIYLVIFFKSSNVYSNIHSLLSLPITVRELCISRIICNAIRLFIWETVNFILLSITYGTLWNETVSYKLLCDFMVYHIAIIQIIFVSECLLVMFGKKSKYPVFIMVSVLLLFVQMFLYSGNGILNLGMQLAIFSIAFCLYRRLLGLENEKIFVRWN